jgi:hypothetical protein
MRVLPTILLGLAMLWLAPAGYTQTDSTKPESTSGGTEERQRDAVDAMMGEESSSATKARTTESSRSTKPTKPDTQPKNSGSTTGDQPRTSTRSNTRSSSGAPTGAVPEVPTTGDLTVPSDLPATTQPLPPTAPVAPVTPPTAPTVPAAPTAGGFQGTAPAAEATAAEGANAAGLENATTAPSASPGTAIIIGLIVLAVLLVALAAVVGFMAAQRTRPVEAAAVAAGAATQSGWAYLSAPEAPNISLHKSPFVIGSSPSCDLRLADPKASPQHARIEHTADGYILTDMNSLNGTYLNGERIASPVSLRPGDQVRMGDIAVTFEIYAG